jgi:hypothetical protein
MSTYHGYFLIADITGYTSYLSDSELEHAQQTLTALLDLLIKHTRPPLIISRLAGDAVISYGLGENFFQGQTFIELIEDTYVAFRSAIDRMVMNTTCSCKACANIPQLDLKFFIHYGEFGLQKFDDYEEMIGPDVIVIHRMLKNSVSETTGVQAYALYSDTAIHQLGLEDFCESLIFHEEIYEHLGTVSLWIQDMHPVWQTKKDQIEMTIPADQLVFSVEAEIELSLETVWNYLMQPEFRRVLIGSDRQVIQNRKAGRIGEGSIYLCYHGDELIRQTVLYWKPFERVITQDLLPVPFPDTTAYVEYHLHPTELGTRIVQSTSKAITGPRLGKWFVNAVMPFKRREFQRDIESFKDYIEADARR